jgi:amidase
VPPVTSVWPSVHEPVFQAATDLVQLLRAGELGAVELLHLHLNRLETVNALINAVVAVDEAGALAQARRADEACSRGEPLGPLHGLPMTIKDSFEVAGMPATCGFAHLTGHYPARDAEVVADLKRAGAVAFGKTNVPEGVSDLQSYNSVYGVTRNPWDLERTPGGSSGGAAAAVAAGLAPLEVGTDIGGSIRCPAHFCGIYGHKPSYTAVSLEGHIPPAPEGGDAREMPVAGPLARDARDLELALGVIAGPSGLDRKGKRWELPVPRHERLEDFRVALLLEAEGAPVDSAYRAALERYAGELREAGLQVAELERPPVDPQHALDVYFDLLFGIIAAGGPDPVYAAWAGLAPDAAAGERSFAARMGRAARQSVRDWLKRLDDRARLVAQWEAFFTEVDVLLCPVLPTVAFPHDHRGVGPLGQLDRTIEIDGKPEPYMVMLTWPGLITVANLPSTVIPTGHLVDGVPAGIQAVGAYLEDRTTIRLATLLQERLGNRYAVPAALGAEAAG